MVRYECRSCRRIVTGSAYRASCPDCGGILERTPQPQLQS